MRVLVVGKRTRQKLFAIELHMINIQNMYIYIYISVGVSVCYKLYFVFHIKSHHDSFQKTYTHSMCKPATETSVVTGIDRLYPFTYIYVYMYKL